MEGEVFGLGYTECGAALFRRFLTFYLRNCNFLYHGKDYCKDSYGHSEI